MAKFFTSAKTFVQNIVHFLLDELCTSRMFRVPFRPKEMEIITTQKEKKLWTLPKTSVRLMTSCQHFCLQSRQYLLTKPLGLTAVRSCRNLIFRRYCYQNVNLPVPNVKEKGKLKDNDEKVTKQQNKPSKGGDFNEIKDNKSNITKSQIVSAKDLSYDDDILEDNLFNSTRDVEVVGSDDVTNLNSEHINCLPLNLQNLIDEVEIETQVFSDLLHDTIATKTEPRKLTPKVVVASSLKPFRAKNQTVDLISKKSSHLNAISNDAKSYLNVKNKVTKLDDLKKLVQSQSEQRTDPPKNTIYKPTMLDPPKNGPPKNRLSIKEIQNLAKKMCDKHFIKTEPKTIKKSITIDKSIIPEESNENKSKIPRSKPHTVDAFSQISMVRLPKVDLEHNPLLVERKNRMEMIKKTLEKVQTVEMDLVQDEIKTMSNAMLKDSKAPTLLTLASRNRYNIEEGVTQAFKKPLPFRLTKDAAKNIEKEQLEKKDDENNVKFNLQGALTSEDIRKKFNPLSSHLQRPEMVSLYSSNSKRQVSSQVSKKASEEIHHKSQLPSPKTIVQETFNSKKSSSFVKSQNPTKERIKDTSSIPIRSGTKSKIESKPKVVDDNMTRNMNTTKPNSWSYLLSHTNKKESLDLKQPKRFYSSTSGYDSDFSNDTESGVAFDHDDMNECKEDDYNIIEVKVKKNLPYLQSHRTDSSINLTGLVDRSIAQELRMQEIEDRKERDHDDDLHGKSMNAEVIIMTGTSNPSNIDDRELNSVGGIYCNQVLCPTSSDMLTRYMNYSSQTESEDLKTKIKCMTSENRELVHNTNNDS